MTNEANIYPKSGTNPTVEFSDDSRANLGLCFSGGGSRALTCAWGQLLGFKTLNLDSSPRYISSVSGGTWASSIYTYLPESISDDDLLGTYQTPENLSLTGDNNTFNVNDLGTYSLGQASAGLGLTTLSAWVGFFTYWYRNEKENYKWLWASVVAGYILAPFKLREEGSEYWNSKNSFSLSLSYANDYFPSDAPSTDSFFYVRPNRPFLIMNDNIMENISKSGKVVQLPNQATPVSAGAQGQTPDGKVIGGGSVESYGYNSTLDQSGACTSPVTVTINQAYSLIDSVSTSSAFFAEALVQYFGGIVGDDNQRPLLAKHVADNLTDTQKNTLQSDIKGDITDSIDASLKDILSKDGFDPADFVPTYNYWPIGSASENTTTQYTDGGTLDNTGVIGMLAQTDTGTSNQDDIYLVVFDNTSTPLEKKANGNIIAGSQAAPLFGIDFCVDSGAYNPFCPSQKDPTQTQFVATSLIQVFDNSTGASDQTPFDELVAGLYTTNCGAAPGQRPNDSDVNTSPAFHQMTLTTVSNPLANVSAGRCVHVLYVQNAKILNWQNKIGDPNLQQEIAEGQKPSLNPLADFKDFPNYSTFFKIGLSAKESNTLSQMSTWALADNQSPLNQVLLDFVASAES